MGLVYLILLGVRNEKILMTIVIVMSVWVLLDVFIVYDMCNTKIRDYKMDTFGDAIFLGVVKNIIFGKMSLL